MYIHTSIYIQVYTYKYIHTVPLWFHFLLLGRGGSGCLLRLLPAPLPVVIVLHVIVLHGLSYYVGLLLGWGLTCEGSDTLTVEADVGECLLGGHYCLYYELVLTVSGLVSVRGTNERLYIRK